MNTSTRPPFHLAFPVHDLQAARDFYVGVLGCRVGRSSERWIDFDLQGHQIVAHHVDEVRSVRGTNPVDGEEIPVPHFGLVLEWPRWEALARRVQAAGVPFLIAPTIRFRGRVGEQGTFFIQDPSGNVLEFKAFRDPEGLFAT